VTSTFSVSGRSVRILTLGIALALAIVGTLRAEDAISLGDLRARVVTSPEEQAMGRDFIAAARKQLVFIEDPLLVDYLDKLGARLARSLEGDVDSLRFFLIDSPLINAFAGPGSRLAVFTGLISATKTEAELASVIAHELGHIAQRHLPRMMDRARQRKLPTTAGILAAILLGGQAGAAAMAATSGAAMADQLSYSREFEREADVLGLSILSAADYPTEAMIRFLKRLDQETRLQSAGGPEYLRTHPLTENRIAMVEARIHGYPSLDEQPSLDFYHARARVRALFGAGTAESVSADLLHEQASDDAMMGRAARYGLVLALNRFGNYDDAIQYATDLLDEYPEELAYQLALAETYLQSGRAAKAVDVLHDLAQKDPDALAVAYYHADALMKSRRLDEARQVLRSAIRNAPGSASLHRLLARVEGEAGNLALSFQALSEYHVLSDQLDDAIADLKNALTHAGASAYLEASLSARLTELETLRGQK